MADLFNTSDFQRVSLGDYGMRVIGAAASSVGGENFGKILATAASVISFTSNASGGDTTITLLSLAAGQEIVGNITSITVTSGNIVAYLR